MTDFDYKALANGATVTARFLSGYVCRFPNQSPHASWTHSGVAEFRHVKKCNDLGEPGLIIVSSSGEPVEGYAGYHEATGIYTRYQVDALPRWSFPYGEQILKVSKILSTTTESKVPLTVNRWKSMPVSRVSNELQRNIEKKRRHLKYSKPKMAVLLRQLASSIEASHANDLRMDMINRPSLKEYRNK